MWNIPYQQCWRWWGWPPARLPEATSTWAVLSATTGCCPLSAFAPVPPSAESRQPNPPSKAVGLGRSGPETKLHNGQ